MCSKCFREHQKRETPTSPSVAPKPELLVPELVVKEEKETETSTLSSLGNDVSVKVEEVGSSMTMKTEAVEDGTPKKKVQTNTGRCFSCPKKVGLLGFKCQCGYVFCEKHRYSDKHECDFDWRARAQEHLSKANPVVKADKVQRI